MPKIVITHVGTSALEPGKALKYAEKLYPNRGTGGHLILSELRDKLCAVVPRNLSDDNTLVTRWSNALVGCLKKIYDRTQPLQAKLQETPAEINSLSQLELKGDDRIVLVCSDTDAGKFCGKLLRGVLTSAHPNGFVISPISVHDDIDILKGVDVKTKQPEAFVTSGLPAYMQIVAREYQHLQAHGYSEIIFNVTGGYKGVIPFATIAAQILNAHALHRRKITLGEAVATVVYVHEEAIQLVRLDPRLPIQWEGRTGLDQLLRNIQEKVDSGTRPTDLFEAMLHGLAPAIE